MWQIVYSMIFRVLSSTEHECKVELILTVGSLMELLAHLKRNSDNRLALS